MMYFIISHNRPEAPRIMKDFLAGIEPIWILGSNEDEELYRKNGAVDIISGKSLLEARNFALNLAFEVGEECVQCSDDLVMNRHGEFIALIADESMKRFENKGGIRNEFIRTRRNTLKEISEYLLSELNKTEYKLAGILPTTNALSVEFKNRTKAFILGDLFVCKPCELRFDENMTLKEDYDFTIQHIKAYGGVMRCDNVYAHFRHESKGGVANIRNEEKEQQNITYLKDKWGEDVIADNIRRKNQIRIRYGKL